MNDNITITGFAENEKGWFDITLSQSLTHDITKFRALQTWLNENAPSKNQNWKIKNSHTISIKDKDTATLLYMTFSS